MYPSNCSYYSVGATTPLFIAGLVIGVPGAITTTGAAIAEVVVDKTQGKRAEELIKKDEEKTKLFAEFLSKLQRLAMLVWHHDEVCKVE